MNCCEPLQTTTLQLLPRWVVESRRSGSAGVGDWRLRDWARGATLPRIGVGTWGPRKAAVLKGVEGAAALAARPPKRQPVHFEERIFILIFVSILNVTLSRKQSRTRCKNCTGTRTARSEIRRTKRFEPLSRR